ncbi:TonB-dependent receptor [Sphingosinicella sp. BN140058]|uniref:TonB-dependent receptor n=1 Tax=Sphingosinicella sp. BN140058 TaxID=1892855 RepID=UPI0010125E81|nr:TonB-dependent receptor [Sphingosinicella sp. BN140058]QAY78189.1 TonB-dependent receptor [Sphingosinicella sp. BN140058]
MTKLNGALRAGFLAASAVATALAACPATAQARLEATYNLPEQPLDSTLRAIALASGREILFDSELVRNRRAPAIIGSMTAEAAVRAALEGSGLVVVERQDALFVVRANAASGLGRSPAQEAGITITGTRIRGAASASPVIVATRGDLENAGLSDLGGLSRILPQNYTGGQNPGVAGGGQQGGQTNVNNSTTLDLRGLGADATLTLVNGHRVAYDSFTQGIDIGTIPLVAVERVEVIPDGASALYGSDAVAGVANILLRRDYQGAQLSARVGAATGGGSAQQQIAGIAGTRWASGGFMAAFDHSRSSPIEARDRDYAAGLDPSATLIARYSQASGTIAGHQRLADWLDFELDALVSHRSSEKANVFFTTSDVFTNGLLNRPTVDTYAITPTLRAALPGDWQASLSVSRGASRTEIYGRRFLSAVETRQRLVYGNRYSAIEAGAEGPLFTIPGGPVRLAIGGGLRSVALDVKISQVIRGASRVTRDITEARDIQFAYGELSVPLVGAVNAMPLVERLRLSAALRYERYQGIDSVATPKLGLIYQPTTDLILRASWGRSFKIPTLFQVNQAPIGVLYPSDLFLPPSPPLGDGATVLVLDGGNPDLGSERATTWTVTAALTPRIIPGIKLEASYFDIDYRDRVGFPVESLVPSLSSPAYRDLVEFAPSPARIAELLASLPLGLDNLTDEPFDADKVGAILDARLRNTARERARGVDVGITYQADVAAGTLQLDLAGSYLESERQLTAGLPVLQRAGLIFNPPRWRGRLGASYEKGRLGLSGFLNYVGSVVDDRFPERTNIGPFVTLDLSGRIRAAATHGPLRGVELRISARNLLDEHPDPIRNRDPAAPPYDSTNQSPIGRFLMLSVSKSW